MAARRKRPEFPEYVRHAPDAPAVVQAAQVAFVVMQKAKQKWWSHTIADPSFTRLVVLTDEQQQLLEDHRGILPFLSRGGGGDIIRTVMGCPVCGRFVFVAGSSSAPKACPFTLGCEGSPVRAKSMNEPDPSKRPAKKEPAAPAPEAIPEPETPALDAPEEPPATADRPEEAEAPGSAGLSEADAMVVHGPEAATVTHSNGTATTHTEDDYLMLDLF